MEGPSASDDHTPRHPHPTQAETQGTSDGERTWGCDQEFRIGTIVHTRDRRLSQRPKPPMIVDDAVCPNASVIGLPIDDVVVAFNGNGRIPAIAAGLKSSTTRLIVLWSAPISACISLTDESVLWIVPNSVQLH